MTFVSIGAVKFMAHFIKYDHSRIYVFSLIKCKSKRRLMTPIQEQYELSPVCH